MHTSAGKKTDATTSGNQSGTLSAGTFVYDTSAPTAATLTTNGNYHAAGWSGHVDGTTTDSGTGSLLFSAFDVSRHLHSFPTRRSSDLFTTATCPNWVAVSSGGTATAANN